MKKLRNAIVFLLSLCAIILLSSCAGTQNSGSDSADLEAIEKNDTWYNIQNSYYQQYLFEQDGMLVYGNTERSADEALWSFTKAARRRGMYDTYAIRNKASGRFLVPQKNSDRIQIGETENPFCWTWQAGRDGIILGDSRANAYSDPQNDNIVCMHMEGRKGYVENSVLNKTWGTPQWLLREYGAVKYRLIQSEDTGLYLFEDENDDLKIGAYEDRDSRFHWVMENTNNNISIRNRRTGHNITIEHIYHAGNNLSLPVKAMTGDPGWKSIRWLLPRAGSREGIITIDSGWDDFAGFRLYHRGGADSFVYFSDTLLPYNGQAQWRLEEVITDSSGPRIPETWVRLRNAGRGDFLYELPESGSMVYGKIDSGDPRSHWLLVRDAQQPEYFRLRGRVSGNDASLAENSVMIRMAAPAAAGSNALWELSAAEGSENFLFRNLANAGAYLNIDRSGEKGYAEGSNQSTTQGVTQWMLERAPETAAIPRFAPLPESEGRAALLDDLRAVQTDIALSAADAFRRKDEVVFTVYAPEAASYPATVTHQAGSAANIYVNGIMEAALPGSGAALRLPLKPGINTIGLKGPNLAGRVESLAVQGGAGIARRGAAVPWRQYEAEAMATNAAVLPDSRIYRQISSEASGRGAVRLERTGDYVEFTAAAPLNSFVIRYCIPDAPGGGGIDATLGLYVNGQRLRDLQLTSKYSWVYGGYPWTNTPDDLPHRFFDDSRFLLDTTVQEGAVIRLQKDAQDSAGYYIIDLVDTELAPPPYPMPANALSIAAYGAVANDGRDDTAALMRCINAAVRAKKEVWIPQGVWNFNNAKPIEIGKKGAVIRGAGIWHSVLSGVGAGFMIKANDVSFYDFSLAGEETGRNDLAGRAGFEISDKTMGIKNINIHNIWMEHLKVGVWTYRMEAMHVTGCRIRNTYADGINLCAGSNNNVLEQNAIRNTGDDAIALWSWSVFRRNNTGNKIRFNTAGLQWLANNVALYGGQDNEVTDNILHDTVAFGAGISVSAAHDPVDFKGTVRAARNTLLRCGGHEYNFDQDYGAVWILPLKDMDVNIILSDNDIIDSSYQGLSILGGHRVDKIIMENNHIDTCGTWGIDIGTGMSGSMILKGNIISGAMTGPFRNVSGEGFLVREE